MRPAPHLYRVSWLVFRCFARGFSPPRGNYPSKVRSLGTRFSFLLFSYLVIIPNDNAIFAPNARARVFFDLGT